MPSKKKPDRCEIVVLLDRSGSMSTIARDMEGGFNQFVKDQQKAPGDCTLTLVQFDGVSIDTVHEAIDIDKVPNLDLLPRGNTPLLDAAGKTITSVRERIARMAKGKRPQRVMVVIITDGQENASREFKKDQVKALVEQQTKAGWKFMFLGANVDAFEEGASIGILRQDSASYTANEQGAKAMFLGASAVAMSYRGGDDQAQLSVKQRQEMFVP